MKTLLHPSSRRLRAFARGESDPAARRAATANHLTHCARCRAEVRWLREMAAAARVTHPAPAGAFETIRARLARGDRVLLPDIVMNAPSARRRYGPLAAAAGMALMVAGLLVVGPPDAGADKSELWIDPANPTRGATLTLRYRATSRLSGESVLRVRARYSVAGPRSPSYTVTLGELRRGSGDRFTGRITLPDSAVYAVLAIEDTAARFVDDHGQRWVVLRHDDRGVPDVEAFRAHYNDLRGRNTEHAVETLRRWVLLYPNHPAGWYFLQGEERIRLSGDEAEAANHRFRAELRRFEARAEADLPSLSEERLWYLGMLADALGDTVSRDRWRAAIIERFPTGGAALQQAAFLVATRHRGDPAGRLAALDSLWRLAPAAASQVAFDGANVAYQLGDPELMLTWTERFEMVRPELAPGYGLALIQYPATRDAGMARLREALRRLAAEPGERPLSFSAAEHAAAQRRLAGQYLAGLGRALLDDGNPAAALDTLDLALDAAWNPSLFRALGDARLAHGDTTGALEGYARLVADPNTDATFADSLRGRLAAVGDDPLGADWEDRVAAAREAMRRQFLAQSANRAPLRARLRLQALDGAPVELRLGEGEFTVVAFWSRYCPPSVADLERLDRAAARLRAQGIRFASVTDQLDGAAVAEYLHGRGLTMPVWLDPYRDAHNAFDNRATPSYMVVDRYGAIRFTSHSAEDLLRHVAVLQIPGG